MAEPHVPADCKLTDSTCEGLAHHIPVVGNRRYNFGQLSSIEAPPLHMGIGRGGGGLSKVQVTPQDQCLTIRAPQEGTRRKSLYSPEVAWLT